MCWCMLALLNVILDGIDDLLPAAPPLFSEAWSSNLPQSPLCSLPSQTRCRSSASVRLDSPPTRHPPCSSRQPFRRVKSTEQMAGEILHGGVLNLPRLQPNRSNRCIHLRQNPSLALWSMSRRASESASETRPRLPHNQTMTA